MTNISNITSYGAASFRKARRERPQIRRRRAQGHLAFTIITIHSRYIVRLAIESGRALGECVRADSGRLCEGFKRAGHCYLLGHSLILVSKQYGEVNGLATGQSQPAQSTNQSLQSE